MKSHVLDEPELEFAFGAKHIDPRTGVADYGPADHGTVEAPSQLRVGIVGDHASSNELRRWLERCSAGIDAKASKYPKLFPPFPGVNADAAYRCELVIADTACRTVPARDLLRIADEPGDAAIHEAVRLYLEQLEALTEAANVDVVLCVKPEVLDDTSSEDQEDEELGPRDDPPNFHDTLKAKAMRLGVPLQIIRAPTWRGTRAKQGARPLQDEATRAWNLFTALYYKAKGTPWRFVRKSTDLATCYIGISFFRTLDRQALHTAVAQVFDQRGDGLIVRGAKAAISKVGRQPYLQEADARTLLNDALDRYRTEHLHLPARIVLHKTSRYEVDERRGFEAALEDNRISVAELVWVFEAPELRLFRNGVLPPARGTTLEVSEREVLLYTRGTVPWYGTYPGMYVPRPVALRVVEGQSAMQDIATETLILSKMNWNQAQLDGRLPITIRTSRSVGQILRHLPPDGPTQSSYAYYM